MARNPHVMLDVYDANRKKLCSLFDSKTMSKGQAYNIIYTNRISGGKTVTFNIPYLLDRKRNFRWNFIKNEYLLRQRIDSWSDWFIIHSPKKMKDSRSISNAVTCDHLSTILKTKNLYLTFDDTNGIGTLQYLMEQVLKGTGWSLGVTDTFYERDGETEKIRSISNDGKTGSYQLTTEVCNLFKAYPVFHGETKTVDIFSLNNKTSMYEMVMGKDIDSLSVEFNSDDIITRLYVEGEYTEDGYVGIDDVNPTGLSYLMNFDYYKSIGMFTDEHQVALDKYYQDMSEAIAVIKDVAARVGEKENELNNLWGQIKYIIYPITDGEISGKVVGGEVLAEDLELSAGNELTVLQSDGKYREETVAEDGEINLALTDTYAVKFILRPSALIGSKEVAIEAKEKLIDNIRRRINEDTPDDKLAEYNKQIEKYLTEIQEIYDGNEEMTGLYELMSQAVNLAIEIKDMYYERETALTAQEKIEADFQVSIGDMLKEGYWNNDNYALGQEQFLYEDAIDMMNHMAWPEVKYQISRRSLARQFNHSTTDLVLNMNTRVYDPDLGINDVVYISGIIMHLDSPKDDAVELSNEDITQTGVTFDSILSRMTRLADQIDQKNSLYNRAEAITKDGSIYIQRLEGTINVLKNQLSSTVSSWYTDANGNIIFESTTGKSAMMLTGDGFMIANGKLDDGTWNWRTFGTGEGFTADAIITGYLSADRIEANTITVEKLHSGVGATIDLSENNSIKMIVESSWGDFIHTSPTPPEEPKVNDLWLDTSMEDHDILKRWDGSEWIETTLTQEEIDQMNTTLSEHRAELELLDESISLRVTQEQMNTSLENKADADWVTQKLETIIQQTAEDITFQFNQSKEFVVEATGPFQEFMTEVKSYQRFTAEGIELGQLNSPFITKLGNEKLSFIQDGVEVAYIQHNKLFITEAQITDSLSIGTEENGYFDWYIIPNKTNSSGEVTVFGGMALKWRG